MHCFIRPQNKFAAQLFNYDARRKSGIVQHNTFFCARRVFTTTLQMIFSWFMKNFSAKQQNVSHFFGLKEKEYENREKYREKKLAVFERMATSMEEKIKEK